jgi:cytochrome c oxidase subunit 3
MLFAGSLVAYLVTRAQNPVWRTASMPGLPRGLLASTALLLVLAVTLRGAERAGRDADAQKVVRWLAGSVALGCAFLVAQGLNWLEVAGAALPSELRSLYVFTFFLLTALHALHVLFGLGPLVWVLVRAARGRLSLAKSEALLLSRRYWDFLLVVWLVLLGTLSLAS